MQTRYTVDGSKTNSDGPTTQTTLSGEAAGGRDRNQIKQDLHTDSVAFVLWEIGLRDDLDDTLDQLKETHRICVERGLLDGSDSE